MVPSAFILSVNINFKTTQIPSDAWRHNSASKDKAGILRHNRGTERMETGKIWDRFRGFIPYLCYGYLERIRLLLSYQTRFSRYMLLYTVDLFRHLLFLQMRLPPFTGLVVITLDDKGHRTRQNLINQRLCFIINYTVVRCYHTPH
jgi:hypothetical protein